MHDSANRMSGKPKLLQGAERKKQFNHLLDFLPDEARLQVQPALQNWFQERAEEQRIATLNRVERARERLRELGGPPTKQTITDALERSEKERREKYAEGFVCTGYAAFIEYLRQRVEVEYTPMQAKDR